MKNTLHQDVNRFAQWAVRVWNVDMDFWNPEGTAREGIKRLEAFYHSIGLGTRLGDLGVGSDRLEEMAAKGTDGNRRTVGNFVALDQAAVRKVLEFAL